MKNRLQIRHHIPNTLPTREEAINYLNNFFTYSGTSLPAEPLVLLYNDTPLDVDNGITEKERLKNSNIILAIGKGGDGDDIRNNENYFIIDFAKHDEEIISLTKRINDIDIIISHLKESITDYINTQISDTKESVINYIDNEIINVNDSLNQTKKIFDENILNIREDIVIVKEYINNINEELNTTIEKNVTELNASISVETEARESAVAELNASISVETEARESAVAELNASISAETEARESVVSELNAVIKENELVTSKALNKLNTTIEKNVTELNASISAETEARESAVSELNVEIEKIRNEFTKSDVDINTSIFNEIERATEKENKLQEDITNVDNRLSNEVQKNKVISNKNTIKINSITENGTDIDVNVDKKTIIFNEDGVLSVDSNELLQYEGENAISINNFSDDIKKISLNINPFDKVLTNDKNGLYATLDLKWSYGDDGHGNELQLIGKNGEIISRIDIDKFLKDDRIEDVILNTDNVDRPYIIFKFNHGSIKDDIKLDLKDIIKKYYNGKGLSLNNDIFEIKLDENSESYLSVSDSGIKIKGIDSIKSQIDNIIDVVGITEDYNTNSVISRVSTLETTVDNVQELLGDTSVQKQIITKIHEYRDNGNIVNVSNSDKSTNFLTIEESNNIKSLAVRSINSDSIIIQNDINVAGLETKLGRYSNGDIISSGTALYDMLQDLLCNEIYPENVYSMSANASASLNPLTLELDNNDETVEVGTNIKLSKLNTNGTNIVKNNAIISGMTWGYVDNNGNKSKDSFISKECTVLNDNDNYTISLEINGFESSTPNANYSGNGSVEITNFNIGSTNEGTNELKIIVNGPAYTYSAETIDKVYYLSNLDNNSNSHMSESIISSGEIQTPTETNIISINGKYKYFMGYTNKTDVSTITSDDIRNLFKEGFLNVNDITVVIDDNSNSAIESNGESIIIACPEKYNLKTINNSAGINILSNFSIQGQTTVKTGEINTNYNVYIYPIKNNTKISYKNVSIGL